MPDPTIVLTALGNDLAAHGLVRRPGVAGPLPPLHIEPRDGAPAPGERPAPETDGELVVTARLGSEVPFAGFEAYRRVLNVDVIYRSSTTAGLKAGRVLDAAIRAWLVERNYGLALTLDPGGAPVLLLSAGVFGGLGPVDVTDGIRTERASYSLEVLPG